MARKVTIYCAMMPDGGDFVHAYGKNKGEALGLLQVDYGFESFAGVDFTEHEVELNASGVAQALNDVLAAFCVNEH